MGVTLGTRPFERAADRDRPGRFLREISLESARNGQLKFSNAAAPAASGIASAPHRVPDLGYSSTLASQCRTRYNRVEYTVLEQKKKEGARGKKKENCWQ